MYTKKKIYYFLLLTIIPLITACGPRTVPAHEGGYYYRGIYFGAHLTKHYKEGIRHGCKTARGFYKKSHWLFNNSSEYYKGWFIGRNRCRHLLRLDENGDLIP